MIKTNISQKSDLRELIQELYYLPELYFNKNDIYFGKKSNHFLVNDVNITLNDQDSINDYIFKYEYISILKNRLEFDNIKLNEWINLIFGIEHRKHYYYDGNYYKYFDKNLYIILDTEEQKKEEEIIGKIKTQKEKYRYNEYISCYEFGIIPIQIYDEKLEEIINKSECYEDIQNFNLIQFQNEHESFENNNNLDKCFKCEVCVLSINHIVII